MASMSYIAGGPNGPNVPPPPGQGPGSGPYGYPEQPGQPNPYGSAPPGAPKRSGLSKVVIGVLVASVLLLLLCCGGAALLLRSDDGDPAETPTTSSSATTEPTSETTSGTAGGASTLPEEFNGWQKVEAPTGVPAGGGELGAYEKDGERLSIVLLNDLPGMTEGLQSLWSEEETVGDALCGTHQQLTQCARTEGGQVILATGDAPPAEVAAALEAFIAER